MVRNVKEEAERLQLVRIAAVGKKQSKLCRATGFSSAQWAQYETGVRPITIESMRILKAVYGIPSDYILFGTRLGLPAEIAEKIDQESSQSRILQIDYDGPLDSGEDEVLNTLPRAGGAKTKR